MIGLITDLKIIMPSEGRVRHSILCERVCLILKKWCPGVDKEQPLGGYKSLGASRPVQ